MKPFKPYTLEPVVFLLPVKKTPLRGAAICEPEMQKNMRQAKKAAIAAAKGKGKGAGKKDAKAGNAKEKETGAKAVAKATAKAKAKVKITKDEGKGSGAESGTPPGRKPKQPKSAKSPTNRKPGAAKDDDKDEPQVKSLGCPKCRFGRTGCGNCRNPNYRPRGPRKARLGGA